MAETPPPHPTPLPPPKGNADMRGHHLLLRRRLHDRGAGGVNSSGTARFGIMLDSGFIHRIYRTRAAAVAAKARVNEARRICKAAGDMVTPRRAIALVCYKREEVDPNAARMGRNGGKARAAKLSPARRKEIAQQAARARWGAVNKETIP